MRQFKQLKQRSALCFAGALAGFGLSTATASGVITALATERSVTLGGSTVVSFNNPSTNGVGGYAVTTSNTTGGSNQTDYLYGNIAAGAPGILASQQAVPIGNGHTLAIATFTGLSVSSMANDGTLLYTMTSSKVDNTGSSVDALLVQAPGSSTPSLVAYDGAVVGGTSAYASKYYSYNTSGSSSLANLSSPKITRAGDAYFYIDGVSDSYGGTQTGLGIFRATPGGGGPSVILKTGDSIAGSSGASVSTNFSVLSPPIDTSNFSISPTGANYIDQVVTNTGTTILVTGTPMGGATQFIKVGSTAVGGINNEVWTGFSRSAINDSGTTAIVGSVSSSGSDYALAVNGVVQFESGSTLPNSAGGTVTLGSSTTVNPDVKLNSEGDYLTIYQSGALSTAKLIFDGTVIAQAGTLIDTNGDSIPDTALTSVNGGRGIALSDPLSDGTVDIYFFGSINGSSNNTLLRDVVSVAVPEPVSWGLIAFTGLMFLVRRRTLRCF